MDGDSFIPLTDEQAKLGQEVAKAARGLGEYIGDVLGDIPKDLAGILIGDRLKARRIERLARLWERTQKRLNERGVVEPDPPPLKLALPILDAAADESRAELQDLWERLLASTMDPGRNGLFRRAFTETVKQMDPVDARVFSELANIPHEEMPTNEGLLADRVGIRVDEVSISIENLEKLRCLERDVGFINPRLSPFGRMFAKALA